MCYGVPLIRFVVLVREVMLLLVRGRRLWRENYREQRNRESLTCWRSKGRLRKKRPRYACSLSLSLSLSLSVYYPKIKWGTCTYIIMSVKCVPCLAAVRQTVVSKEPCGEFGRHLVL